MLKIWVRQYLQFYAAIFYLSKPVESVPISKIATVAAILNIFEQHFLLNHISECTETQFEALGRHGEFELLKLFRLDIQDVTMAASLNFFKQHFLPNHISE